MPLHRTGTTKRYTRTSRTAAFFLVVVLVGLTAACAELAKFGQLSDREGAFSIGNAKIEQQQDDDSWKQLGKTDGHGRIWILKKDIDSGGRIRITKSGYYPLVMEEGEFLQDDNLLMTPSGGGDWGAGYD